MTQHGMTSLWEMDFVQDYHLSQRSMNGKSMHPSQQGSQIYCWMTAAKRWKQVVKQGIAPHCAQQAAASSTPSPCRSPASATDTDRCASMCSEAQWVIRFSH